MSKKVCDVQVVDIQFVTGYNLDRDDLAMGGSPVLGHFTIVAKEEAPGFIREIKKHIRKIGKSRKIRKILMNDAGTRKASEIRRGRQKIDWFKDYLNKESNWALVDA